MIHARRKAADTGSPTAGTLECVHVVRFARNCVDETFDFFFPPTALVFTRIGTRDHGKVLHHDERLPSFYFFHGFYALVVHHLAVGRQVDARLHKARQRMAMRCCNARWRAARGSGPRSGHLQAADPLNGASQEHQPRATALTLPNGGLLPRKV